MNKIPTHVAIIMDGNGRWAKARGWERAEGHRAGVEALRSIVESSIKAKVKYLTVYAFSNENWHRPQSEIDALMNLMVYAIAKETPDLKKNGVRLHTIGDIERLPQKTRDALNECIVNTADGKNITLVLALSYSARWEIIQATKKIVAENADKAFDLNTLDELSFSDYLSTHGIPDPDLLIRTGGEQRISNFLLWQSAYAELYFTDVLWPDFGAENLFKAILDYQMRERRFGKTSEQINI